MWFQVPERQNRMSQDGFEVTWVDFVNHDIEIIVAGLVIWRPLPPYIGDGALAFLRFQHELRINLISYVDPDANCTGVLSAFSTMTTEVSIVEVVLQKNGMRPVRQDDCFE